MKPKTPKALLNGHKNLFSDIESIISLGGDIGEKAKLLADISHPHFKKEEEFALPPLSLLLALSEGNWKIESKAAIEMSEKLEAKLSEMKEEHDVICKILENLKILSEKENNKKIKRFANGLKLHIEIEEQVLYPATILIGEYLKNPKI